MCLRVGMGCLRLSLGSQNACGINQDFQDLRSLKEKTKALPGRWNTSVMCQLPNIARKD